MEKYIFDEGNGLWYELQGDYYLPCLKLPEEEQQPVGLWGNDICSTSNDTAGCFTKIC